MTGNTGRAWRHTHTHAHTYTHTHTRTHTQTHTNTHTHARALTHTAAHTHLVSVECVCVLDGGREAAHFEREIVHLSQHTVTQLGELGAGGPVPTAPRKTPHLVICLRTHTQTETRTVVTTRTHDTQ